MAVINLRKVPDGLHLELKRLAFQHDLDERARGTKMKPGPGPGLKGVVIRPCEAYVDKHLKGGSHGKART